MEKSVAQKVEAKYNEYLKQQNDEYDKAEAELDNVVQLYVDYSVTEYAGAEIYLKGGIQHATIVTLESLNSGSTYPNRDVLGYTLGLGAKGDLPYGNNLFYKNIGII